MTAIAKDMTLRGIKSKYGNRITLNIIHHMLKNRRYLGEYRFRDIVRPNAFHAIISEELFERVQKKMIKNQKAPARHKAEDDYILSTKLKCGKCGAFMVGECGTSKTGIVHHYYKCASAKRRKGCDKKAVKKEWIEDLVVNYTMKIVMDDELIDTIADRILNLLSQENTKIPQLQAKLKEIDGYINNILDAIQQGLFNASAKKRLDDLEQTKAEIETAIYSEQLQKPEITKEHILCYIERYRKINVNDLESRKRLINAFVNSIYLYDNKIVFAFNYKDGTKSVSLAEIEEEMSLDLEASTPPAKRTGFYLSFLLCVRGLLLNQPPRPTAMRSGEAHCAEVIHLLPPSKPHHNAQACICLCYTLENESYLYYNNSYNLSTLIFVLINKI